MTFVQICSVSSYLLVYKLTMYHSFKSFTSPKSTFKTLNYKRITSANSSAVTYVRLNDDKRFSIIDTSHC